MENITIIIHTKNRPEKLARCLASIPEHPWIQVIVCCDGGENAQEALKISQASPRSDMVIWCRQDMGVVARGNLVTPLVQDGRLALADDIEVPPGTIEAALAMFNKEFPDDDGVLGLHQHGVPGYCLSGITLIGQKFLQRYPGKRLHFPGYYHYCSDKEIYFHAMKLGKFRFAGKEIAVMHHQDGHEGRPCDATHRLSRKYHRRDIELYEAREKAGLIWGLN